MNVLVIPEDFRYDQYVLRPIIAAMLDHIGGSPSKVRVLMDPLLGGVSQALRWERIEEIIGRYRGMTDLFLLCVDRDGEAGRRTSLDNLESQAKAVLPASKLMLGENAWQEIEVWLLAGQDLLPGWNWRDIREEVNPKEAYFRPFARDRGLLDEPGEGRRTLGREAAHQYDRIRTRCPEDVVALEDRIRLWVGGTGETE